MKSLSKNSIFNVIYTVLNVLFPLLTSMYVARILMTDGVGIVSYAQNTTTYFISLAALGIPTYGIREISKRRSNQGELNKVFTELLVINFISTLIASICFVILISSTTSLKKEFSLYLACGIQLFLNFINIDWLYKGEEEYVYIAIRSIIVKLIAFIAVILFIKEKNDYVLYALISSLALAGNYIFNIFRAKKYVTFTFSDLKFKHHIKPIIILAFSIILSTIYSKVDITMIGLMVSDSATGLYTYAHKIVDVAVTFCISISAVFLPRLSLLYKTDKLKFNELLKFGFKILTYLTIPLSIGVFILAPQIVEIMFGIEFIDSVLTVRIFCLIIIIKSYGDLFCYQLVIATGNETKRLPAYISAAVLNIILNFVFIPIFAQNGAAMASVIAELIVNGIQMILLRKIIKNSFSLKPVFQAVTSSAIMFIVVYLFVKCAHFSAIYTLIFGAIIGMMVYVTLNIIFKNEITWMIINKFLKGENV